MFDIVLIIVTTVLSYFIGCFNAAYFYGKKVKKTDIRDLGSGNAGSTNVLRSFGVKAGILVFLVDVFKGYLAVTLTKLIASGIDYAVFFSAVAVISGHNWPIFLKGRGGKGIATSLGTGFGFSPLFALISFLVALVLMFTTRYVAIGSVVGMICNAVLSIVFKIKTEYMIVSILMALMAIVQHRVNFVRLMKGEEHRMGSSKKK